MNIRSDSEPYGYHAALHSMFVENIVWFYLTTVTVPAFTIFSLSEI